MVANVDPRLTFFSSKSLGNHRRTVVFFLCRWGASTLTDPCREMVVLGALCFSLAGIATRGWAGRRLLNSISSTYFELKDFKMLLLYCYEQANGLIECDSHSEPLISQPRNPQVITQILCQLATSLVNSQVVHFCGSPST